MTENEFRSLFNRCRERVPERRLSDPAFKERVRNASSSKTEDALMFCIAENYEMTCELVRDILLDLLFPGECPR